MSERLLDRPTITELTTEPQPVDTSLSPIARIPQRGSFDQAGFERMLEADKKSIEAHLARMNGNGRKKPEAKRSPIKAVDMKVIFTVESLEEQQERESLSNELLWLTTVDITNSQYAGAKKEYGEISPEGRFKGWDFKTYTIFYITRTGEEHRNSVRGKWEADVKADYKARWYRENRNIPKEERPIYNELEADKEMNREGM